jgi:hypothetical protein
MTRAANLLGKKSRILKCIALLEAADHFWKPAVYSRPHFGQERETSGYSNKSSDHQGLADALEAVSAETEPAQEDIDALAAKVEALQCLVQKEKATKAAAKNARTTSDKKRQKKSKKPPPQSTSATSNPQQVKCRFFSKGKCRYGAECRFSHEL